MRRCIKVTRVVFGFSFDTSIISSGKYLILLSILKIASSFSRSHQSSHLHFYVFYFSESEEQTKSLNETAQEGGNSVNTSHQHTNIDSLNLVDSQINGFKKIIPSQNDVSSSF